MGDPSAVTGKPVDGQALVLRDLEHGPEIEDVITAPPGPGEVRVRVTASGICGSDLHVLHGRSEAMTLPVVMGHEGAGVVDSVGPGVTTVAEGDHVVIALYGPCHQCPSCGLGRFNQCTGTERVQAIFGRMADGSTRVQDRSGTALHPMVGVGSLAQHTVVRESQLVKIDAGVPLDLACLAGCGVTTGVGAVLNTAQVTPGETVAVVGCGGVGLNVVQAARIAGATTIIALDTNPTKLALAEKLGATDTVDSNGLDVPSAVQTIIPGGVDVAFEVVGSPALVTETFMSVRPGGRCVMVGSPPPGETIPIDGRALFSERRLLGCLGGSNIPARDIPRIIELHRRGNLQLDALVTTRRPLTDVATAIQETERGEVARSVVTLST